MSDAHDAVGSLGEEAVKLLAAMSTWADEHTAGGAGPSGDRACSCAPAATCAWCPVCQALSTVRAASPQLKEQLVASGLALTAAARIFLEAVAAPPVTREAAPGDVEHIDLSDDGGEQPWD